MAEIQTRAGRKRLRHGWYAGRDEFREELVEMAEEGSAEVRAGMAGSHGEHGQSQVDRATITPGPPVADQRAHSQGPHQ